MHMISRHASTRQGLQPPLTASTQRGPAPLRAGARPGQHRPQGLPPTLARGPARPTQSARGPGGPGLSSAREAHPCTRTTPTRCEPCPAERIHTSEHAGVTGPVHTVRLTLYEFTGSCKASSCSAATAVWKRTPPSPQQELPPGVPAGQVSRRTLPPNRGHFWRREAASKT